MTAISGVMRRDLGALMKANHGRMARGLSPKTRDVSLAGPRHAFVIDSCEAYARSYRRERELVSRFMARRKDEIGRVCTFETTPTSVEIDVLNVCLSLTLSLFLPKRPACRLRRLTFRIRHVGVVSVLHFVRLRKSLRLNQFVALAYSQPSLEDVRQSARILVCF